MTSKTYRFNPHGRRSACCDAPLAFPDWPNDLAENVCKECGEHCEVIDTENDDDEQDRITD